MDTLRPAPASGTSVVEAACALRPAIEAAADDIERERKLPDALVTALDEAGLFSMLVPRAYGGGEVELLTYARAVEELARADGSVAWCVGQAAGLGAYVAYFDPRAAREVFLDSDRRAILANGPGEHNRPGRAVPEADGYRISGRWTFASGSQHATWLLAICQPVDVGADDTRLLLLPIEDATFLDTWHVSGLRGTGSHTFVVDDLFVPGYRCVHVSDATRREHGPLYQFYSFRPIWTGVQLSRHRHR